jgi:hypothetical protein
MTEQTVEKKLTRKEKKAKRAELFSLKAYLYKKAQVRAVKLQYRADKRNGTLPTEPVEGHVHGEACSHDHEHVEEEKE